MTALTFSLESKRTWLRSCCSERSSTPCCWLIEIRVCSSVACSCSGRFDGVKRRVRGVMINLLIVRRRGVIILSIMSSGKAAYLHQVLGYFEAMSLGRTSPSKMIRTSGSIVRMVMMSGDEVYVCLILMRSMVERTK